MRSRLSKESKQPRLEGVAPPQMLREDFDTLNSRVILRCSSDVEQLILIQAVEGHAHYGHGRFYGKTYPNTTLDDISRSLKLDPNAVRRGRQELIDEIHEFVERVIAGEEISTATNIDGEPLLRCGVLRHLEIDPKGVLQGLYLGGLRDEAEIRKMAHDTYGVQMGYGKCYMVDQKVLRKLGLDGYQLARKAHEEDMDRFEEAGLFATNGDPHVAYMYVRFVEGPGASDDGAIVIAGMKYGLSAAIGCFLADAVDTLEKYVPVYDDQDSGISEYIEKNYADIGVTRQDAAELAYLCSIPRNMQGRLPDSSLRHLLQIDRRYDQSTIESHLAYVAGRPYDEMDLDHGECTNAEFYSYIEEKLKANN